MTSVQQSHHIVSQSHSSSTGHNLDNNLDALLDDLQTSVTRPGTSLTLQSRQNGPLLNGGSFNDSHINLPPGATGYREITTTVTQETNGVPMTSREYQIEYLNPANSVTVLDERSSSPAAELLKRSDISGQQASSYKTESYFTERSSEKRSTLDRHRQTGEEDNRVYSVDYPSQDRAYQYSRSENYRSENANLNKNLNELDVLLKELNTNANQTGTPSAARRSEHTRIETRSVERSPGRGYTDSPVPKRSSSSNREVVYNERNLRPARAHSPGVNPGGTPRAPQRSIDVKKEVNTIEQRSHTSRRDSPSNRDRSVELSPTLRRRTPSPTSGEFRPATFSSYPLSPKETQTTRTVVSKTYNYSSTGGRRTPTPTSFDDSQPYRSPSPISFPQTPKRSPSPVRKQVVRSDSGRNLSSYQPYRTPSPISFPEKKSPTPARKNLSRSDSGRSLKSYQVSQTSQPPLSDPNSPTVITYKYTSHSREHNRYPGGYDDQEPLMPRPFPTNSPVPVGDQNPPKKLDELMASFQDGKKTTYTEYHSSRDTHRETEWERQRERDREREREREVDLQRSPSFERNLRPTVVKATQVYTPHQQHYQQPVNEVVPPPTPPPAQPSKPQQPARSVAGPPVYYPPGVELFTKKEEMMEQQSAGGKGKMKGKAKMKYKYEKSEKSKEKSSSGMAAVPVCLPVCCAMPCVIM